MSPLERWVRLNMEEIRDDMVPFPAPGGPMMMARRTPWAMAEEKQPKVVGGLARGHEGENVGQSTRPLAFSKNNEVFQYYFMLSVAIRVASICMLLYSHVAAFFEERNGVHGKAEGGNAGGCH